VINAKINSGDMVEIPIDYVINAGTKPKLREIAREK
jgi:hypothetical protein